MRQLGDQENVPVVDLTSLTESFLAELGDEASKPLFVWPVDNTHLKPDGAIKMVSILCSQLQKFGKPYSDLLYRGHTEGFINDEVF